MTDWTKEAKVGDRVWHEGMGKGEITFISSPDYSGPFIKVKFNRIGESEQFNAEGCRFNKSLGGYEYYPSLYWSRPEIIAPPKPKRTVKKKVKVRPSGNALVLTRWNPNEDLSGPVQEIGIEVEE